MGSVILFAVVAIFVVVALVAAQLKKSAADGEWPFYAKKPLSNPELVLYFRLRQALPNHIVLAQVALSRILGVKKGHNFGEWFNRINRMSADFVVCAKDAAILAVIELDDSSHERNDRKAADKKKDKALSAAGIRVVRWNVKALPDEGGIRAMFSHAQQSAPGDVLDSTSFRPGRA